ncbi:hypothetical protein DWB68_00995 [Galactobacter valiniphilus]|uniref:Uncharacterized protein n=1 Tax=Galactobacter valiniphilus TaxID=2676122 RepID=A0A399JH71_9MICC|nr:hypothetical protein DWB68_00995 [Galactobacter valiniphilus]
MVGSGVRRAAAVVSAVGVFGTGALGGCSVRTFPGVYQECPSNGSCVDTGAPQGGATAGPVRRYTGDDPVDAARALAVTPAWAAAPRGKDCGSVALTDTLALESAQRACFAAAIEAGEPAHTGWWATTTEGDPIVTLAQTDGARLKVVEITAFDSYGGSTSAPAQGFTCIAAAGYVAEPGSQQSARNPGKCMRD